MKKIYDLCRILAMCVLCACVCSVLVSCSDDDDNGGGGNVSRNDDDDNGGGGNAGGDDAANAVMTFDGERLSAIDYDNDGDVSNYGISYDAQGRVKAVNGGYDDLEFDYSKGTATINGVVTNVKFNSNGYITELSGSWDYVEEYYGESYHYKGNGVLKFSYSNNRLSKVTRSAKETYTSSYTNETWSDEDTYTFTWNADNLVQVKDSYWEEEDGETYSDEYITKIQYGSQENKFSQLSISLMEYAIDFDNDALDILVAVGLFGKGTANLPTKLIDDEDDPYSLKYTLNSNGAIAKEIMGFMGYDEYAYKYYYGNDEDAKTRAKGVTKDEAKKFSLREMFVKQHRNHNK